METKRLGAVSAYAIAVEHGYTGSEAEWLASLKGERGEQGEPGAKGDAYIITEEDKTEIAAEVESKYTTELGEIKQDLSQVSELTAYETNVVYELASEVVSGTGTYVYKDITVYNNPIIGDTYTAHFDKVEGASNNQPLTIYFKDDNGSNIDYIVSTTNVFENYTSRPFIIPNGCKSIVFRLYASKSGAVTATYYGVKLVEGAAEQIKLKADLQARFDEKADKTLLDDIIVDNMVLYPFDKVVSGTGTYVYEDVFIDAPFKSTTYTVKISEIIGATNPKAVFVETLKGATSEDKIYSASNQFSDIIIQIKTTNDTDKIRIRLYPSTSGAITSTFKGISVLFGKYTEYKRILSDDITIESVDYLRAYNLNTIKSIAHRGYWKDSTECLPLAYINAKKMGFDAGENDVSVTADGQFVMWHDADLHKIGLGYDAKLSSYTLAELKAMDFNGEKIMTFKEWVYLCKRLGLDMCIDFKAEPTDAQFEELVSIVRRAGMLEHAVWVGYLKVRNYDPHATVTIPNPPTQDRVERYRSYLADGKVIFHFHINDVTEENVSLGLDNGFGVECWCMEIDPTYGFSNHQEFVNAVSEAVNKGIQGLSTDNNTIYSVINEIGY